MYHVGIDWADQKHDFAIVDQEGDIVVKPRTIPKNYRGFEKLLKTLRELCEEPEMFRIGIETPHNLIVDFLVDLGYRVFTLFPGLIKEFRKRYRVSGAHDDPMDALVLADSLRTDKHCWRPIDFGSDLAREIRILARDHHTLVDHQVMLKNSLRSTLNFYYPEYVHFFSDITCKTSLAFIQAYPHFESAKKLSFEQLDAFFKEQRYHKTKVVNNVYTILHQEHLKVAEPVLRAKQLNAVVLAQQLAGTAAELESYTERLVDLVERHPDGEIFMSHPAVAHVNAARLIALFGDNRQLFQKVSIQQALAGTCPVTNKSGKSKKRLFRFACNKFNRDVMHQIAFSSLTTCPWAKRYYQKHRTRGKTHSHALRCLANIHLKILFAMWRDRTKYDENIFLAQKTRQSL